MTPKKERREYNKKYYREHKEKLLKKINKYRLDHIEEIREQQKQFYKDNKDRLNIKEKKNYILIPRFSNKKEHKQRNRCYMGTMTKRVTKTMVESIKDKVLEDCINNPGKYLE